MSTVKLPGLPHVTTGTPSLDRWIQAVNEHLNAISAGTTTNGRNGSNGYGGYYGSSSGSGVGSDAAVNVAGGNSAMTTSEISDMIRGLKLYKDLVKRLDDPTRFDHIPEQVRAILLVDIAAEAKKRGADIQDIEYKMQSATESLAYKISEVTAAVDDASAGIRETAYAAATADEAQAGRVTQLVAALSGVGQAALEEDMQVVADRVDGLSSQYTLKVQAGKAIAGFGLAATENTAGDTTSSFIVMADKFALVGTDVERGVVPFVVDSASNPPTVYINGALRVGTGGPVITDVMASTYKDYIFARKAGDAPATPTGSNPGGIWQDTPPSGSDPLYMSSGDKTVTGNTLSGTWSIPVRLDSHGQVKGVAFTRWDATPGVPSGGSFASPNPVNPATAPVPAIAVWSDGIPADNNKPLWMSTRLFTSDGNSPQQSAWTSPQKVGTPSTGTRSVFSVKGTSAVIGTTVDNFHVVPAVADAYMGTQTSTDNGATWGAVTGITQIKGESGQYIEARYATGTMTAATGTWMTTQPTLAIGQYLWMKTRIVIPSVSNPVVVTETNPAWGTPVRISGENSVFIDLTNDSHPIPCNVDGSGPYLTGASTTAKVFEGFVDKSSEWSFTATPTNVYISASESGGGQNTALSASTVYVRNITADTGYVDFKATKTGYPDQVIRFSVYRAKGGGYSIVSSANVIRKTSAGAYTPASPTFSAELVKSDGSRSTVAGYFKFSAINDSGTVFAAGTGASTISTPASYTIPANTARLKVELSLTSTSGTLDSETLNIVADGAKGDKPVLGVDYFNGVNGASVSVQYSSDNSSWHNVPLSGDLYIRTGTMTPPATTYTYATGVKFVPTNGVEYTVTNGKNSYLHIKYSDNGTSFTANNGETPGSYVGMYSDNTLADSLVFSAYTWVYTKGQPGTNGTNGTNGTRGTVALSLRDTSGNLIAWNDTSAASLIPSPIKGDIIYYKGGAKEYSVSSWGAVTAFIDGSMVVSGTLAVNALKAGGLGADGYGEMAVGGDLFCANWPASMMVSRTKARPYSYETVNTTSGTKSVFRDVGHHVLFAANNAFDNGASIWGNTKQAGGTAVSGTYISAALPTYNVGASTASIAWNALGVLVYGTEKSAVYGECGTTTGWKAGRFSGHGKTVDVCTSANALAVTGAVNFNSTAGTNGQILMIVGGVPKWVTPTTPIPAT